MKIASWNINALRTHEEAFRKAMAVLNPDIFCLQEIRVREDQKSNEITINQKTKCCYFIGN